MADTTIFLRVLSAGPRADRLLQELELLYKEPVRRAGLEGGTEGASVENQSPTYYFTMRGYTSEEAEGALPVLLTRIDEGWSDVIHVMFPLSRD
jgi:hypothetical protein